MVLWCRTCGAFLGLHEPFDDWTTDRNALCTKCGPVEPGHGDTHAKGMADDSPTQTAGTSSADNSPD